MKKDVNEGKRIHLREASFQGDPVKNGERELLGQGKADASEGNYQGDKKLAKEKKRGEWNIVQKSKLRCDNGPPQPREKERAKKIN